MQPFTHLERLFGRMVATAALIGLCASTASPALARDRYTIDHNLDLTIRTTEQVFFQKVCPTRNGTLVIGYFSYVDGVQQTNMARLDDRGRLDRSFSPPENEYFLGVAANPDGSVWVATQATDDPSNIVVEKLTATGRVDRRTHPFTGPAGYVVDMMPAPSGGAYILDFDFVKSMTRVRKLDGNGNPAADFATITLAGWAAPGVIGPKGEIALIFQNFGGPSSVACFDPAGTPIASIPQAVPDDFHPFGVAIDASGAVILSGQSVNGGPSVIRIYASGQRDASFNGATPDGRALTSVVCLNDGSLAALGFDDNGINDMLYQVSSTGTFLRILPIRYANGAYAMNLALWNLGGELGVSGQFTTIGDSTSPLLARVSGAGLVNTGFHPTLESTGRVAALSPSTNGGILIGGTFTRIGDSSAANIALLSPDNTVDTAFPSFRFGVSSFAALADGSTLVVGQFNTPPSPTPGLVKLRADRTIDPNYLAGTNTFQVNAAIGLPDGSALIGGDFGLWAPATPSLLLHATAAGTIDPDFYADSTATSAWGVPVSSLALESTGTFLVAGDMTAFQASPASGLVRVSATGIRDTSFVPQVMAPSTGLPAVRALTALADGRFYAIGCAVSAPDSSPTLFRCNADGSIDTTFTPCPNASGYTVAPDGSLYVATQAPGGTHLIHVTATGSADTAFSFDFDNDVDALLVDSAGNLLVGGGFEHVDGKPHAGLVRIVHARN